jgi:hypothetical protein
MRTRILLLALLTTLLLALSPRIASAHGMRGAYLEITEIPGGQASVHLRLSAIDPSLALVPGAGCSFQPLGDSGSAFDRSGLLSCDGGLLGHELSLRGLGPIVDEAVVSIAYADGSGESALLRADQPGLELQHEQSGWTIAGRYLRLGVVHIATGYDHLIFLLLLVLVVRTPRRVLLAETAFTLSHTLSFSATALGWIHVSSRAAEACIAVSLLLLALDAERRDRPVPSRWAAGGMAFVFGLVHGLGFAGGLREIGVPESRAALALAGFGMGVEVGQVVFLGLVLGALHLARSWSRLRFTRVALVYGAGALAAYWSLARIVELFARA